MFGDNTTINMERKKNRFLHPTDVWRGRHLSQTCCLFANCGAFPSSCFIQKISYHFNSASIHMVILIGRQVRGTNSDVFQHTQIKKFEMHCNIQNKQLEQGCQNVQKTLLLKLLSWSSQKETISA